MKQVNDSKDIYNFSKSYTQAEFGKLIGIEQSAVSGLVRRGVINSGDPVGAWILSYCAHMREIAAGRQSHDGKGLDLVSERAKLTASQNERVEMQNAVTRREYGPIEALEFSLSDLMTRLAAKLDTIPGKIKLNSDKLTADDIEVAATVIAEARNDIATWNIDWFDDGGNTKNEALAD